MSHEKFLTKFAVQGVNGKISIFRYVSTIYFLFAKVDLDEILQGCTYQGIQRILGVLIPEIIGNIFLIKNTLDQSVFTFVI